MKVIRFDARGRNNTYSGVENKDAIYRQLRAWGVKSPDDRHRIMRAIHLAAAKMTDPPPLPNKGEVALYGDRHADPKLKHADIIEFLRVVWGKWMKSRVLTRKFLRSYDPAAERALRFWILVNKRLPDDIYVPTIKQINDDLIVSGEAYKSKRVANVLASRLSRGEPIPQ